jgi:hypothetical protein
MFRTSRSIVFSAKPYVVRVTAVKRVTGATLALFDIADTLPQRGLQVVFPARSQELSRDCLSAICAAFSGISSDRPLAVCGRIP